MFKIIVIGAGYVGLTTAACLAELGNKIFCVDIDKNKIEKLKNKEIPFFEPQLEGLVKKNLEKERLFFSDSLKDVFREGEIIFICVGTPSKENGSVDLKAINEVISEIKKLAFKFLSPKNLLIVIKSTVPVGTCQKINQKLKFKNKKLEIVSNPEFLREGRAVNDFMNPDRIVIGVENKKAKEVMLHLYKQFKCPKVVTNLPSAEMIKYASNAFLATKISFINEIANVCENVGADVLEVARGMGLDRRIGEGFLRAGLGYGGSCFPKDVRALHYIALNNNYDFKLLKAVIEVNQKQREFIIKKLKKILGKLKNKTITILGLAFKPQTDDIRESAALEIIELLKKEKVKIKAYDPVVIEKIKCIVSGLECFSDVYKAIEGADALIIATEWPEFKDLEWQKIKRIIKKPNIVDGRNLLDPEKMRRLGFRYEGVGRGMKVEG